jgi:hypothetical protein
MIYRLNAGVPGTQVLTAQNLLGVGITLNTNTIYEFEGWYSLYKTAGAVAHTISFGFGGTATINNIAWQLYSNYAASASSNPNGLTVNMASSYYNTTGLVVSTGSLTGAQSYYYGIVKGTVSINAGGTFIPQYLLSADPGGPYTTQIGTYFKVAPIGGANTNINIGGWA